MSLPTLEKTWQYRVNQQIPSTSTINSDCQTQMYNIKLALTSFASNPWTVVRSSNGITAGASDLWSGISSIVASTVTRSWIVLEQTGVFGGPMQICIDMNVTQYYSCTVVLSPSAGFTGGTITARPVATDEFVALNSANWTSTNPASSVLHALMTSDGATTRLILVVGGVVRTVLFLDTLVDNALTHRAAVAVVNNNPIVHADVYTFAKFCVRSTAYNCQAYVGSESYNNLLVATANSGSVSTITGAYPITPLSLHTETSGSRGRLGRLVDVWFGSSGVPSGSTYPTTPDDKEFVQFGPFVFPWNGTAPLLS